MLWLIFPVVDTIHPQSNKSVMGLKIKATGESKLNDSPANDQIILETNYLTPNLY